MKLYCYILVVLMFAGSPTAFAMNCPSDASRIEGAVNPESNPEEFYKVLQNDVSMGALLRGITAAFQTSDYSFITEYSRATTHAHTDSDQSSYRASFVLKRSAFKFDPSSPLKHNIHMPNLIVEGETNLNSAHQFEACISRIEIQNTNFGRL